MDSISTTTYMLLQYQLSIKLFHWQTHSYAKHVASDNLHQSISKNIDLIVESIQGEHGKRVKFSPSTVLSLDNMSDKSMMALLKDLKKKAVRQ